MRTLETLIRLHRYRLDERRRDLAELERLRDELLVQRDKLEASVRAEQETAKQVECGAYAYSGFALGVIARREKLATSLADIDTRIAVARNEVQAAFQELKRYELQLAAREKKQRQEEDRRRQTQIDEVSLEMHRRRSA
jgi:flagellar protein FliJ